MEIQRSYFSSVSKRSRFKKKKKKNQMTTTKNLRGDVGCLAGWLIFLEFAPSKWVSSFEVLGLFRPSEAFSSLKCFY